MKRTADAILAASGVAHVLERYGTPHFTGSYALDLMYGPDIDIVVVTEHPNASSRSVLNQMLDQDFFQRYEYGDFVRFRCTNRPRGYIVVLAITVENVYWELEIWFLPERSQEETELMQFVRTHLTPQAKTTILRLKHQRQLAQTSKHAISSVNIYQAVLQHRAQTLDDVAAYVRSARA